LNSIKGIYSEINIRYPLNKLINNLKFLIHRNALSVYVKLLPICEQILWGLLPCAPKGVIFANIMGWR